jgi:acetylglutamate kinase
MQQYIDKVKTLVEALPYIKKFYGNTVVIKYGGSALKDETIKNSVMQDIALLKFVGIRPVIVHGGGPEINKALAQMGKKSEFINGCRVTDEETMEIVEMVLAGKLNKKIVTELNMQGIKAVGICGKDAGTMIAQKKIVDGVDLGLVGEVKSVDTHLIQTLMDNDFVPVIAPIGVDEAGNTYNINADYAAVAIAGALKATKLVFLTDVAGVLTDVNDPKSILSFVKVDKVTQLIEDGTISGGMIPKVECCIAGVEAGVEHVHIIDGRREHCLMIEIFTPEGIGTLVER